MKHLPGSALWEAPVFATRWTECIKASISDWFWKRRSLINNMIIFISTWMEHDFFRHHLSLSAEQHSDVGRVRTLRILTYREGNWGWRWILSLCDSMAQLSRSRTTSTPKPKPYRKSVRTLRPRDDLWLVAVYILRGRHCLLRHLICRPNTWLSTLSADADDLDTLFPLKVLSLHAQSSRIVASGYPMFMYAIWDVCGCSQPWICDEDVSASEASVPVPSYQQGKYGHMSCSLGSGFLSS